MFAAFCTTNKSTTFLCFGFSLLCLPSVNESLQGQYNTTYFRPTNFHPVFKPIFSESLGLSRYVASHATEVLQCYPNFHAKKLKHKNPILPKFFGQCIRILRCHSFIKLEDMKRLRNSTIAAIRKSRFTLSQINIQCSYLVIRTDYCLAQENYTLKCFTLLSL